ncbi:outer membrane protein assembly factor BamB family protein [Solicola gregarius]|uniref:PQQ-like beta-propeller repeat protein n=1 Tax=Solicola gregarius TaxID=2908642 RepID=A0AA46TLN5_9ACTN|nr:PQQ-binding-like beta-propeller repeat protein [Solicola gregarius]UYM07540.1 PQQ-like beta-propeller repeat protein [Solicola gregarius]
MRRVTFLAPLVLAVACGCSSADGHPDQTAGSGSSGSNGSVASSPYDVTWTSGRDAEMLLTAVVCGGAMAGGTIDASRPVVLEDMRSGRIVRPRELALRPDDDGGLPPVTTFTCADTSRGPRIVVEQTMTYASQKRTVHRLSGLEPGGEVAWTRRLGRSADIATIEGGTVALTIGGDGLYDRSAAIDAADGSSIVTDVRLDRLKPVSTNRLAYFESDTLDPVITDAERRPVARVSLADRIEPRLLGWVGGDGIAVLTAAQYEMTAFDADTGRRLWSLPTGDPGAGESTIDVEAGVLITTDSLRGEDLPAPTGRGPNTYAGIDVESGDVLWRWSSDLSPSELVAAGGAFAVEPLGAEFGDGEAVFDSRTGTPIELADEVDPVALSSDGILVADGAKLQLLSRR